MEKEDIVGFIPVRGGSKSIPLKNIKPLLGRPLIYWTLDAAVQSKSLSKVYVCTDSKEIEDVCNEYKIQNKCEEKLLCIGRPAETATDTATSYSVLQYFAENYKEHDTVVFIQATSPLLTTNDIEQGIKTLKSDKFDCLLSVARQKRFIWKKEGDSFKPQNYDYLKRPRRQDNEGYLVENGAFYIAKRKDIVVNKCLFSGKIGVYEMPEETYFEIDEISDFIVIEALFKNRII